MTTRRGLPGFGLLTAPLRAAVAGTQMAANVTLTVAAAAGGTALIGGTAVTEMSKALRGAAPDVGALTRAAAGVAVEALGGLPARRCSTNGPRRWIEVRGLGGENGSAIAAGVLASVRATPGVRTAFLNRRIARVVVTVDSEGPSSSELAGLSPTPSGAAKPPAGSGHHPAEGQGESEATRGKQPSHDASQRTCLAMTRS